MTLWYVETWGVPPEQREQHEQSVKKWIRYKRQLLDKEITYLRNRFTAERIMISKFESLTEFDKTFELLYSDEQNVELLTEWRSKIIPGSWRGSIWTELE